MSRAVIGDELIQLRPLSADDAEAHLAGCDRAIVDSLGGGEPPTEAQVRHWLTGNASAWVRGEPVVDLGIEDKATGALCGIAGLQRGLDYLEPGEVNLTYSPLPEPGAAEATQHVPYASRWRLLAALEQWTSSSFG